MPCQCLLITHHYGCIKYCAFYATKEKLKISLVPFKETTYVTTNCFRNHPPAGINELTSDQHQTMWCPGCTKVRVGCSANDVSVPDASTKGWHAFSARLSRRVKLLSPWLCHLRATSEQKQIFAGEQKGRFTEEIFLKQYCEKTMELSQNGISCSQQKPAGNNGLANTAKRKQEYKILSHLSLTHLTY